MRRRTAAVWSAAIAVAGLAFASTSLAAAATTQRVDVSSSGEQSNGYPGGPQTSADGRYVTFVSDASNLVPGDTNRKNDVFVRDRKLHTTTRVSVSSTGAQLGVNSYGGAISADGRYVVFDSGDVVFVRDLKLHKTTQVSVSHSGGQPNSASGFRGSDISADGRYIAFMSRASNLVRHDTNGTWDVFVRDQKLGTTKLVSVAADGQQAHGQSFSPAISANGRYVAFESRAKNLVHGDTNEQDDVFVRDRKRHTTRRVSVSSTGHQADSESSNPVISNDGRYVAFSSHAQNLVNRDTNGVTDVFVRDRKRNTTRRVSVSSHEHQGNKASRYLSMSADGRYIAFATGSSNLVPGDTNHHGDVFVRDRKHHKTKRVSLSSAGKQGNEDSLAPAISDDGHSVAFYSQASNLVPGDTNGKPDVFVRGPLQQRHGWGSGAQSRSAAGAMTFTAGAEASKRKVLCGNFSGQGPSPHHAYKPAHCNVTATGPRGTGVAELRSMRWARWGGYAKGRGLVTRGGQHTVRLRRPRPCGSPKHRVSVYSQMKIGRPSKPWIRILYCGD